MNSLVWNEVRHSRYGRRSRQDSSNHVHSLTLGRFTASDRQQITAALGFRNLCHFVGTVAINLNGDRSLGVLYR